MSHMTGIVIPGKLDGQSVIHQMAKAPEDVVGGLRHDELRHINNHATWPGGNEETRGMPLVDVVGFDTPLN